MAGVARDPLDSTRYHTILRRAGAFMVDSLVVYPFLIFATLWMEYDSAAAKGLASGCFALVPLAYSILAHGCSGRTLGKLLLGIQVLELGGARLGYWRALLREAPWIGFTAISLLQTLPHAFKSNELVLLSIQVDDLVPLYFIASAWTLLDFGAICFDSKRRTLHDWIADSVVVRAAPQRWATGLSSAESLHSN